MAAYCEATMRILEKGYSAKVDTVLTKLDHFKQTVDGSFKGLDANDIPTVIHVLREHTAAPTYTDGYPQLLTDLYDFAPSAADLDTTATTWLEQDLAIVKALAAELASLLKLPRGSSVGDVWPKPAASGRWAPPRSRTPRRPARTSPTRTSSRSPMGSD
ncbi:MAG: hypothetical protein HOY75_27210 [Streptomyces sp.]|nr:hypothetical protein [Streptomyces sp.]